MKTILVTGGYGLVGSAIQSIQFDYRPDYYFMFLNTDRCDLLNYSDTEIVFKAIKPHYVIHLAACVGGLFKNMSQKVKMLEDNLIINTNVLKCSYAAGVKNLIACLSTCVFPDKTSYPINETMINDGPPHPSNEGYAYSKRILETQCKCYNEEFGTNYFCIIPTNIYGPNDNFNLEDSHVIPGLIHKCFLAKQNGAPFIIKGTGKPLRQFIYSKDLAKIIMELLINYKSTESIIISPTKEYSIYEVAEMINCHFNCELITCPIFSDGQYRKTADNSKLMDVVPNFEFTDLNIGISETIFHFIKEYPNVRK